MSKFLYNLRIKELKEKYHNTPGIIDFIESELESQIVVLIEPNLIHEHLPKTYHKINLEYVDAYVRYKHLSDCVDYLVLNEPLLWDAEYIDKNFEALVALTQKYKESIHGYERNKKHGRSNIE